MNRPATREDLEEFARFLARITLEIERGQRDPDQLRTFMPDQAWNLWRQGRPPGKFAGGPIQRTDIGRPRVELVNHQRAIANVVTATDPNRWGALTMQLDATSGRWRATSIQRLYAARHYRNSPSTPVVTRTPQQRLEAARIDRDQAAAALTAVNRRFKEHPRDSSSYRNARELSTTWQHIVDDLDREISTLLRNHDNHLGTGHVRKRTRRI